MAGPREGGGDSTDLRPSSAKGPMQPEQGMPPTHPPAECGYPQRQSAQTTGQASSCTGLQPSGHQVPRCWPKGNPWTPRTGSPPTSSQDPAWEGSFWTTAHLHRTGSYSAVLTPSAFRCRRGWEDFGAQVGRSYTSRNLAQLIYENRPYREKAQIYHRCNSSKVLQERPVHAWYFLHALQGLTYGVFSPTRLRNHHHGYNLSNNKGWRSSRQQCLSVSIKDHMTHSN